MKQSFYFSMLLISYGLLACIFSARAQVTVQWDKTLGGNSFEYLSDVVTSPDGGYLLAGYSNSDASGDKSEDSKDFLSEFENDYWIVKVDEHGKKLWDKTFGGEKEDQLSRVIATADGGYLLAGTSDSDASADKSEDSKGIDDYWIIKIDQDGNVQWDKTLGGNQIDRLSDIIPTSDGGYLLAGTSDSDASADKSEENYGEADSDGYNLTSDYWIVKIDKNGNKQWDKTFGGEETDNLSTIITTSDGGYILAGTSGSDASADKSEDSKGSSDYWIVKTDKHGNKLWDRTFGGTFGEDIKNVLITADGGYILAGTSGSDASGDKTEGRKGEKGWDDYWIVKIDESGNKQWDRTFGGEDGDDLKSMVATADGGYLLAGDSFSNASGDKSEDNKGEEETGDYWIVKINERGDKLWDKTLGANSAEAFWSLANTADGGYLLAGSSDSNASGDKTENSRGGLDYWIVKIQESITVPFQTEDAKITNPEKEDNLFGIAVAMDGNTAIVGDAEFQFNKQGAAYIYEYRNGAWNKTARLTAADGAVGDGFGMAVAISGNRAIIGAPGATVNGNEDQGAAYVFTNQNGEWKQTAKLIDENRGALDTYGSAVAIEGKTAIVGAATDYVDNDFKGAVYFYDLQGDDWIENASFTKTETDKFGEAVALDGDMAVVGSGSEKSLPAAYVYQRIRGQWSEIARLTPPNNDVEFGKVVAIDGTTVVVGSSDLFINGEYISGAAYLYEDGNWTDPVTFTASYSSGDNFFARAVAIDGDKMLVSSTSSIFGGEGLGAVHSYTRLGGMWQLTALLVTSEEHADNYLGTSVALQGNIALIGAPSYDDSDAVYVYHLSAEPMPLPEIKNFVLINAETDQPLQHLRQEDVVFLPDAMPLTVFANTRPVNVGSIYFELQGPVSHQQTENYYPYALFGDNPGKDYQGKPLPIGEYTLTATPYQKANQEGKAGVPLTVHFTVTDRLEVESFSLIDAESDQIISTLQDGDVIDLDALGDIALTVRANKHPQKTGSVKLVLEGPVQHEQTENYFPYALFGDNATSTGWDYQGRLLAPGEYTLTATPYTAYSTGTSYSVSFTVIDHSSNARLKVEVFPVPTSGVVNISHDGSAEEARLMLLDFSGNVLLQQPLSRQAQQLDLSFLKKGFYYLKVIQQQEVQVKRIVVE